MEILTGQFLINIFLVLPNFKHCLHRPISDNFFNCVDITLLFLPKQKPILNSNDVWNRLQADSFRHYKNWRNISTITKNKC